MAKLYRPHVPLPVDQQVLARQLRRLWDAGGHGLAGSVLWGLGLFDDSPDLLSKARAYLLHYADISGENPAR